MPVYADGKVRTVTVRAERGNICDRSGTVLVTNSYTYKIQIEYGAIPEDKESAYEMYLGALDLLEETGTERASDLSPFVGSYPNYSFSTEAENPSSTVYKKLSRVLESLNYPEYKNASELARIVAAHFEIIKINKDGTVESKYSDRDIGRLLELRYNMLASDFPYAPYVLAEGADERLAGAVKERHLTGITVAAEAGRRYVYTKGDGSRYASHILGTVGVITAETGEYYTSLGYPLDAKVGRSGAELAFEEYLRGVDGTLAIVEDEKGNIVETYWQKEPIPGKDVWLTIDINVQMAAEKSLMEQVSEGGSGGAVAATDPNTGEVLALASYPDDEANKAISAYAPGSTFKVGMALAALNEGIIKEDSLIELFGSYNGTTCHNHGASECSGTIDVVHALGCSCNYFFAYLGDILETDNITKYAKLYGFGSPTGLEIGLNSTTPEASGSLSADENLDYMSAIGQLHRCTPLQISQYIAMIANGGTRYSAHILKCVKEYDTGEVAYQTKVTPVGSLSTAGITKESIKTVCRGMHEVVNGEGASSYVRYAFSSAGYTVAGKTGTAEVSGQKDNAFFVGYAPYTDPKIVVTAFVEEGRTGGLASGIVRSVMDAYSENVNTLTDPVG
jgi:penicillin-binding protein 2